MSTLYTVWLFPSTCRILMAIREARDRLFCWQIVFNKQVGMKEWKGLTLTWLYYVIPQSETSHLLPATEVCKKQCNWVSRGLSSCHSYGERKSFTIGCKKIKNCTDAPRHDHVITSTTNRHLFFNSNFRNHDFVSRKCYTPTVPDVGRQRHLTKHKQMKHDEIDFRSDAIKRETTS